MIKRVTVTLLMLVSISVLVIAAFAISGNNNSSNNIASDVGTPLSSITDSSPTKIQPESSYNAPYHNKVTNVKDGLISPTAAKLLAKKYIEQPGAIPGTPNLVKQDGKKVYVVPVIDKKKNVGEIYIDAHSGKNLGGAGGAPT